MICLLVSCAHQSTGASGAEGAGQPAMRDPEFTMNRELYHALKRSESRIRIDLTEQSLTLLNRAGQPVVVTDCSTGVPGKETPPGRYRILEKIVDKRSNLYGKYVDRTTGEVKVERSWTVEKAPPGARFLGTAMPYWMRVTWDGVGIHVGSFPKGYRSSFGCIRVPEAIQPIIFRKCRVGTPVEITPDHSEGDPRFLALRVLGGDPSGLAKRTRIIEYN